MHVHTRKPLRMIPALPQRPPQANIPQTLAEREWLRGLVQHYVEARRDTLVPPFVLDELRTAANELVAESGADPIYRDYVGILINNEVWLDQLATVPFERRLLLLPKCLRVEDKCPAPFDEFGLLCKQCGLCTIQDLQEEAERLGYAVLVAEGSALVMALIQSGKIDAIVGVSCLSVLERAFPHMEAAAIPGVAIPLLQDDCKDTSVDIDWVWNVVHLTSDDRTRRLDLDALRRDVETWFAPEALDAILGPVQGEAERVARGWLAADGKRWRPFLTACAYKALQDDPSAPVPESVRRAAVAVECFHKASLIHDDIEDADDQRYDRPAVHVEHGVPIALNAGDLLLGDGYRLLASCDAPPAITVELLRIAAAGHRELCVGQGAELAWMRHPSVPTADQIIDIFRGKTSPAFEVALSIGATLAGAGPDVREVLREYSGALGVAYQIRDDLEELRDTADRNGLAAPSLLLALACDKAKTSGRDRVMALWRDARSSHEAAAAYYAALADLGVEARATALLEAYKEEAIRSLPSLTNASLKGLLRRVIGKVFRVEIKGWCSEFETRDAAGRQAGAHAAG
ncbi:MAG TPA: polyprenyl synthetase family protein [Vicinamibacterales bacterium]|nr:polyprenyl synthetase family protein [Vicinamibacterales bacterium]